MSPQFCPSSLAVAHLRLVITTHPQIDFSVVSLESPRIQQALQLSPDSGPYRSTCRTLVAYQELYPLCDRLPEALLWMLLEQGVTSEIAILRHSRERFLHRLLPAPSPLHDAAAELYHRAQRRAALLRETPPFHRPALAG